MNKRNYICTQECVQIKPKDWKQFRVKAPRNLKTGELYEIDFNGNEFPWKGTFSSSLLVTHSGVSSTFQVSGWNSKLLVYLEVRDRIVD